MDGTGDLYDVIVPNPARDASNQSNETPASRGAKRKADLIDIVEGHDEKVSIGINDLEDALKYGNKMLEKLNEVVERQVAVAERVVAVAERQVAVAEKSVEIAEKKLAIIQQTKPRCYSEAEVWELLSNMNLTVPYHLMCYRYLCGNDIKKAELFGVPWKFRRHVLFEIMAEANINKR